MKFGVVALYTELSNNNSFAKTAFLFLKLFLFLGVVYLLKGLLLYYYVMGLIKFFLELVLFQ